MACGCGKKRSVPPSSLPSQTFVKTPTQPPAQQKVALGTKCWKCGDGNLQSVKPINGKEYLRCGRCHALFYSQSFSKK